MREHAQEDEAPEGSITLEVELDLEDVTQLREQAMRALAIERSLPPEARTALGSSDDAAYISEFIATRAANDALEVRNIVPAATPRIKTTAGEVGAKPFTCYVNVYPRPHIGLKSLDPVDLATNRIAKPGFSQQAAKEGAGDVEYLDDVKTLRMALIERLDGELPESVMRALGDEYQEQFERALAANGNDPETYQATHQIDEEQYSLMLTRRALADAHWDYALDAVFVGKGFTIAEDDLIAALEEEAPGYAQQLLELHELRNDLYRTVEKVRRAKALAWLRENTLK